MIRDPRIDPEYLRIMQQMNDLSFQPTKKVDPEYLRIMQQMNDLSFQPTKKVSQTPVTTPMPGDPNFRGPMSPPIEEIEVTAQKRQPGFFPSRIGRAMARGGGFDMTDAQKRGVYTPEEKAQFRTDRNQGIGKMLLGLSDAFAGRPIAENFMAREEYAKQQELRDKKLAEQQRIKEAIMNDPNIPQSQKEMLAAFPEKYLEIITRAPKERKTANIDGVLRYIDTGEQVYPGDKGDRPPERRIVQEGGRSYFVNDDGTSERVFPGLEDEPTISDYKLAILAKLDAWDGQGEPPLNNKDKQILATLSNMDPMTQAINRIFENAGMGGFDGVSQQPVNTQQGGPQGWTGTQEEWDAYFNANPGYTEQELIKAWQRKNSP